MVRDLPIPIRVYPATPAAAQVITKLGVRRAGNELILANESIATIINEYIKTIQSSFPKRLISINDITQLYIALSKLGQPAIRIDIVGKTGVFHAGFYTDGFGVILEYPINVTPTGLSITPTPRAATLVILTPEAVNKIVSMAKR